jgi:predicted patatin/cPLA2 family phospholipase
MTANELADINEWSCCAHSKEVSTMLRQQAQEIEDLKNANRFIQNFAEEQRLKVSSLESEIEQLQDQLNEFLVARDLAILRKASEK